MWYKRSYLPQPLTNVSSDKVSLRWTDIKQKAFNVIKVLVYRNIVLCSLYFNKLFDIYTDTINFQLGVLVIQ